MSYIIGSYNIREFSRDSISKKDIETISDIILGESMDIVAIQEVYSNGKAIGSEELGKYKSLLSYLGSNWNYSIKNPSSHQVGGKQEEYVFLWNNRKFILDSDDIQNNKRYDMYRYPYYARFFPKDNPAMELRLICIHTKASGGREYIENEINTVLSKVFPRISTKRYGDNRTAYTIVLGDYNASIKYENPNLENKSNINSGNPLAFVDELVNTDSLNVRTVQSRPTSMKKLNNDTYNECSDMANSNDESRWLTFDYDHFSYDEKNLQDIIVSVRRINVPEKYYSDENKNDRYVNYYKKISDHLPIVIELDFRGDSIIGGLPWIKKKNS